MSQLSRGTILGGGRSDRPWKRFPVKFHLPGHGGTRENVVKRASWKLGAIDDGLDVNDGDEHELRMSTQIYRDSDFFTLLPLSVRMEVEYAGDYRISYHVFAANDTTNAAVVDTWLRLNNSGTMDYSEGSLYCRHSNRPDGDVYLQNIYSLAAGDDVSLVTQSSAGTGTAKLVADKTWINMELVSYTPGTAGEDPLGGRWRADRDCVIESVVLTRGTTGTAGTTSMDILKNGVSMLGTNKCDILWSDDFQVYDSSIFGAPLSAMSSFVAENDMIDVRVLAQESPFPRDIVMVLNCIPFELPDNPSLLA